jgi:nicotinamidase-related amidase
MSRSDTALLVVDMQERLLPAIVGGSIVRWNVRRLLDGAKTLGVPSFATEQYPQGLGPSVPAVAERVAERPAKTTFSCRACAGLFEQWQAASISKVLLAGIEAHVCVQQTALDLLAEGYRVYIAADAVGSRRKVDLKFALRRLEAAGAILTTTEAALFEWCEVAGTPEFKQISALVRETPPSDASA